MLFGLPRRVKRHVGWRLAAGGGRLAAGSWRLAAGGGRRVAGGGRRRHSHQYAGLLSPQEVTQAPPHHAP
jgi:hypothetical protein